LPAIFTYEKEALLASQKSKVRTKSQTSSTQVARLASINLGLI